MSKFAPVESKSAAINLKSDAPDVITLAVSTLPVVASILYTLVVPSKNKIKYY